MSDARRTALSAAEERLGAPVRPIPTTAFQVLLAATLLASAVVGVYAHAVLGFALAAATLWAMLAWSRRSVARVTRWQTEVRAGDLDRAQAGLTAMLARPQLASVAALALVELTEIALRRRRWDEAGCFARAAMEIARDASGAGVFAQLARAQGGFALACAGDVDGAEAMLATDLGPHPSAVGEALDARSRAYVAALRGEWSRCLEVIGPRRVLVENVVNADDAALVDAIEQLARARLSGATRGAPAVAVDAEARAYVTAVLPAAADLLREA